MVTITHAKVSALADDLTAAAKGEVLPSDWNATHVITGSIASSLEIGATTVTSGTDNYALTVGGGTLGETPIRTILTAAANYYVATTGSDSNPGTLASPWATLQHAMKVISGALDFAGFIVTVNIGTGSFVGLNLFGCVGGGILFFLGAGAGTTIIEDGPNDGIFNFGECVDVAFAALGTLYYFDAVTFQNHGVSNPEVVVLYQPSEVLIQFNPTASASGVEIDCSFMTSGTVFDVQGGSCDLIISILSFPGITGGGGTVDVVYFGEGINTSTLSISAGTVTGALTVNNAFIVANGGTEINCSGATTGAGVVGKRFNVNTAGKIYGGTPGTLGPNNFPGTISGTVDDSVSVYDGFFGVVRGAGAPTTTQFPDSGVEGVYKDTTPGGIWHVYNDGGNIRRIAENLNGSNIVGNGVIATNATDGFLYIPTCAGTPTGTPTTVTGFVPLIFDTTNSQFWIYAAGGWKQPKTLVGAGIVNWE